MKKILVFAFLLFAVGVYAQTPYDTVNVRDPQNFVEMTTVDTAFFQLIGRKANLNRRMSLTTLKNWILTGVNAIDSVYIVSDTLYILQGATLWEATLPSGTIDTAYLSGNTLGIVLGGDTTEVVLAGLGDGNGLFDAANDADTVAVASVILGQDFTVDMDGYDWLFSGIVEDDTTSRIMTIRSDGSLTYRWLDSLLNGYITGSGTAGTLPIWTGANVLGNSSLTESGGNVLATSFTGALKLPAGTSAQRPVGSNGMMRYNTTSDGIEAWDGIASSFGYFLYANAPRMTQFCVPVSYGNTVREVANFKYDYNSNLLYAGTATAINIRTVAGGTPSVFIGSTSTGNTAIGIGGGAVASNFASVAVGVSANASGEVALAIGRESQSSNFGTNAVGYKSSATALGSIAIGRGATSNAANTLVIGSRGLSGNYSISDVYFGSGIRAGYYEGSTTPAAVNAVSYTIHGSGAGDTDRAGGNITIAGGKGSGSGTPGDVIFSTSDAGVSGGTLQTLAQRVWVKGETGQLSVGTGSPNASALVQVESTTQGFLPPRMTTAQRDAIASPAAGLVIFNTTTTKLECYDGSTWQAAW